MNFTAGEILSAIGTLVLMIAVFVGAYYVSKLVARGYNLPGKGANEKRVSVLESTRVGKDSAIMVVKAGERVFLVGATPRELNLLSELDAESFPDTPAQGFQKQSFRAVLKGVLNGKNGASGEGGNS